MSICKKQKQAANMLNNLAVANSACSDNDKCVEKLQLIYSSSDEDNASPVPVTHRVPGNSCFAQCFGLQEESGFETKVHSIKSQPQKSLLDVHWSSQLNHYQLAEYDSEMESLSEFETLQKQAPEKVKKTVSFAEKHEKHIFDPDGIIETRQHSFPKSNTMINLKSILRLKNNPNAELEGKKALESGEVSVYDILQDVISRHKACKTREELANIQAHQNLQREKELVNYFICEFSSIMETQKFGRATLVSESLRATEKNFKLRLDFAKFYSATGDTEMNKDIWA
ncbi:hypothetical protein ACO0QE_002903 [Hanseniaspora vineae]